MTRTDSTFKFSLKSFDSSATYTTETKPVKKTNGWDDNSTE